MTGNWRDFGHGAPVTSDEPGLREQQEERLEHLDEVARRSRVEDALDYIGGITADDPRTLHLLHTLLPHSKWEYAPSGRTYCGKCPPRPGLVENIWSDDDHYVRHGYQRHLMQVALADRILGRLVERLEETGLYDETLLVVTADHGASFWPGSPLRHLANNPHPSDILDVPLFVKLPGQEKGVVSDRHVRTIDIVPTILDRLGVEVPPEMDGSSVFDPDYEPAPVKRARDPEGGFTDFDADPDLKYASLDRKISLFGSGSDGSIYAVREHHWLLGKPLPELEVASDSPWYISTDRTYLEDAGKSAAFAPLYVQGAIDGTGVHEQLCVVAVVDDTIVAVSRAIRTSATRSRFFFMLPEESFGTGTVRLDVLVLDESGDEPRILGGHTRPVGFTQPPLPPRYLTAPPSASP